MKLHLFKFHDLHLHGDVFINYLALRKQFFVDSFGWDVPHNSDFEMDQYDNPCASYSIVTENGMVVAGARVLPCSATWGNWTYMLNDAHRGLIDIPALLDDVPLSRATWECTRLVVQKSHNSSLALVVQGLCDLAYASGGSSLISLSPLALQRALQRLGYQPEIAGEKYKCSDGRLYRPFKMNVKTRNIDVLPQNVHTGIENQLTV